MRFLRTQYCFSINVPGKEVQWPLAHKCTQQPIHSFFVLFKLEKFLKEFIEGKKIYG